MNYIDRDEITILFCLEPCTAHKYSWNQDRSQGGRKKIKYNNF